MDPGHILGIISPEAVARGKRLFERHGAVNVFFACFITGVRVIAGSLAGILHVHWPRFALFNFLGVAAWVTTVVGVRYFRETPFESFLHWSGWTAVMLLIIIGIAIIAAWLWPSR